MSAASLLVLIVAHGASDPVSLAFERAARGVLGPDASVTLIAVPVDPDDEESERRGADADGVIELSWAEDVSTATIHCYVVREQRWVEREIRFGNRPDATEAEAPARALDLEASERGRLLGFAAAAMFSEGVEREPNEGAEQTALVPPAVPRERSLGESTAPAPDESAHGSRLLEFAGIASSGVRGTAGGLGAMAGLRLRWAGPVWSRAFVAGRAGNIPEAQASTRTLLLGAGLALNAPLGGLAEMGVRVDLMASYFSASHLSEDDVEPVTQSRWLPAADLMGELGVRLADTAGVFGGVGWEAALGKTDVYTHGNRMATVPMLRFIGEIGFRTGF